MAKAIGAGLALLVLVFVVPAALWLLTGPPPVPTGFPDRGDLTQPLGIDALLVVFRAVVWLAWLQFVVCTLAEVASLVRGGGLPRPVPLSGHTQALARALVGTALVGGIFLGSTGAAQASMPVPTPSGNATTSQASPPSAPTATAGQSPTATEHDEVVGVAQGTLESSPRVHVPGVPQDMTDVLGKKVVIVQPPDGHYHDNLWDIAEKSLGDGRRWQEIFDLNKGRIQPDGQELVLGRLIQPGWVLIMPEDAVGAPRVSDTGQAAGQETGFLAGGVPQAQSVQDQRTGAGAGEQAMEVADRDARGTMTQLARGGLLSAALLLGLVAERRRRRGRLATAEELEAEVELRIGADTDRAERLDVALRSLAASCELERLAVPQAHAVTVSTTSVTLHLAPPTMSAPSPWTVHDDGARWELPADADLPGERGPAPYPGLVCLGRDDDGNDVLLDLEALGGLLSLGGSDVIAREVVSAWAVQLAVAPWADEQVVRGYHLEPTLATIGGTHVEPVDDLEALVTDWAGTSPRHAAADVLTGQARRTPGEPGRYLVMGAAPTDPATVDRLARLVATPHSGVGVVACVPVPGARWQLDVDDTGRLHVPLLGIEVDAVRLTAAAGEQLAGLFAKARQPSPIHDGDRVAVPRPPRSGRDDHFSVAAVRVGVLGALDLRASNAMDPARVALASEIVTFLAVQPAPVHRSVVGASIWPGGVTPDVRDATIDRVRDWLGLEEDGSYRLRETEEGRLHLSDDVAVDWHAFCQLALESRGRGPDEERELLRRALQLVRGELLEGRPAQRYSWLARTRLERQVTDVVTDAAHRLVELSLPGDPGGAGAASRAGLRLSPTSQVLWRDLLRSASVDPDGSDLEEVAVEMRDVLRGCGAPLDAETEALLEELLPGRPHRAGGALA
ncbi:hypothetical protein ASD66_20530 [Nocardioides sp. Root151]|nr:hypothetical protein ASD66_20530 [Nocardioides sp. Root151]KRF12580.1 hypothetical protein ASH02_13530 [Nocardioides sp. Soil796]